MMPVLWFIGQVLLFLLKVLLVILAVVLVLAVLLLVLPIRYECTAKGCSEQIRAVEARGKIQALLGLAGIRAKLSEGVLRISLHIGGFTLKKMQKTVIPQKEASRKDREGSPAPAEETAQDEADSRQDSGREVSSENDPEARDDPVKAEQENLQREKAEEKQAGDAVNFRKEEPGDKPADKAPENKKKIPEENRKKPPEDKKESSEIKGEKPTEISKADSGKKPGKVPLPHIHKKRAEKKKPPVTPESPAEEESGGIVTKIRDGWEALQEQKNQRSLRRIKRAAGRILRHILPKELKIHGIVGTGDPASTGWILGLFYMFWPVYGGSDDYRLVGEFEKMLLKGKIYSRGRIIPAVPVFSAAGLLLDGNIRRRVFKRRK